MLAEILVSCLCIFFLFEHTWVVLSVISINLFISALLLVAGAKSKDLLVIEADKYNQMMERTHKDLVSWKLSQISSEIALTGSFMPLCILTLLSRTSQKDLELWMDNGILPYLGSRECPFIRGSLVIKLFKDEKGVLHLADDYHKPLTAADVKAAVESLEEKDTEESHD